MKEKKNIDRLYQENLKNFEVFPPNKSWNIIEKQLAAPIFTKEKRSKTSYWVRISSIAAAFLMFLSMSAIYIAPNSNFTKRILNTFTFKNAHNKTTGVVNKKKNTKAEEKPEKKQLEKVKPLEVVKTNEIKKSSTKNEALEKQVLKNTKINESFFKQNLLSIVNKTKKQNPKTINEVDSKFTVATIFAPVYFNTFEEGSSLGNQFKNSTTTSGTSYSYGVKFAYKLNEKFSVQSGVNLINLESNTNNVYIAPGVAVVDLSSLRSMPISKTKGLASKTDSNLNTTTVSQQFGYIEIPVEVKYNVVDGKVGVNIVGGFSTMLLNKDEVHLKDNNISQHIGASNNLRPVNFSGNLGVDVDYSIKKNLYINVSPMFKVQTSTLSKNSAGVQPYYIGVYTGINYKF